MKKAITWIIVVILLILLIGIKVRNAYNNFVGLEEAINSQWSQVENQYQRRYDLIPNLVETVKGYAAHEKETFTAVTEARAKVGQMNISGDMLTNPDMLNQFQAAQSELSSALSRLMVVAEDYPELKANQNFLALQDQLEGTENRISVERKRFNDTVQIYNRQVRTFPNVIFASWFGFEKRPYFESVESAATAPEVKF